MKPVALLYQQPGTEVCTYRLLSSRYRGFGTPAAVLGSDTEAWVAGPSAAQLAMEDLVATAPPAVKKNHSSISSSSSAGQAGSSRQQPGPSNTSASQQDEVEATATAVLLIKAPKCKQSERKRGRGRAAPLQRIEWLSVRKHMLPPQLAMWDPARLVVLCLMASWFSRGSIGARLLLNRRFGSSKAGPKRQQQPDFQADVSAGCWKVVTAGDLHGSTPALYLISTLEDAGQGQQRQQQEDRHSRKARRSSRTANASWQQAAVDRRVSSWQRTVVHCATTIGM
eukprot:jgi/Sobl393_1/1313/SZX79318.1